MAPLTSASTQAPSGWRLRRARTATLVLATGCSSEGDQWALLVRRAPRGVRTHLQITTREGLSCPPVTVASRPLQQGRALTVFGGRGSAGPAWLVLRLCPEVAGARVLLSDGTRHDLPLIDDGDGSSARVAVLVYPRRLDVHRIDPCGIDGECLDDLR